MPYHLFDAIFFVMLKIKDEDAALESKGEGAETSEAKEVGW